MMTPKQKKDLELKARTTCLLQDLQRRRIAAPVGEHIFFPIRKWRFDFCWPDQRIALEIEGGVFTEGRHTRGSGFINDMQKYNAAAYLGWRVIRTTWSQLNSPTMLDVLAYLLAPAGSIELNPSLFAQCPIPPKSKLKTSSPRPRASLPAMKKPKPLI